MERRFQSFLGIFLAVIILGALAACGGGGGDPAPAAVHTLTGTYSGSFTGVAGDPDRTWVMTVNQDMTVTGYGSNMILIGGVLQNETITGTISNGTDFAGAAAGGCALTGKVDLTTGILSGTWVIPNSNPIISGTFTGKK